MNQLPPLVRPVLKRLARRLALGLFLDRWPAWAAVSLLIAGVVAIVCRLFVPGAAVWLSWLWLAPVAAALPVMVICALRAYRPAEVVGVADWLGGGHGTLLTLLETGDQAWATSSWVEKTSALALPRIRPWRKLAVVVPAAAFLAIASALPQRALAGAATPAIADEIAADLTATLAALTEEKLVTPAEEERLEKEIERIREATKERIGASSWEAADALREQLAAGLAERQDALKWAQDSLSRAAAAVQAGASASAAVYGAELAKALEKLAASGLVGNLPPELQRLLKEGKFGTGEFAQLAAALAKELGAADGRLANAAGQLARGGRFNADDFPLATGQGPDGDGDPGRGGINRGRADAQLTWGKESQRVDRFKSTPLPPGAARSPDDWTPTVALPGAPEESARTSSSAAARHYAADAGQAAWRRSLAPRHQSAVKKYFDK